MTTVELLRERGAVMTWVPERVSLMWMVEMIGSARGVHAAPHPDVPAREDGCVLMWAWWPSWKPTRAREVVA